MLAQEKPKLEDHSRVILPGEGTTVPSNGDYLTIKVRGSETNGAWAMVQAQLPPRGFGPPLHINSREDEIIYILSGNMKVQLGERILTAGPGATAFIPKGSVHTFCNPFDEPVTFLGIISPAGFEGFFEDMAALAQQSSHLTPEERGRRFAEIGNKYGSIVAGPPMPLTTD
ncbi:MAG: cupin domain-containing protein [Chloroflexia bacterium]